MQNQGCLECHGVAPNALCLIAKLGRFYLQGKNIFSGCHGESTLTAFKLYMLFDQQNGASNTNMLNSAAAFISVVLAHKLTVPQTTKMSVLKDSYLRSTFISLIKEKGAPPPSTNPVFISQVFARASLCFLKMIDYKGAIMTIKDLDDLRAYLKPQIPCSTKGHNCAFYGLFASLDCLQKTLATSPEMISL